MSSKRVSEMTVREIQEMAGAAGVVKVRLSGELDDIGLVAAQLHGMRHAEVVEQSRPYPNRRDPGVRVYLTVRVSQDGGR